MSPVGYETHDDAIDFEYDLSSDNEHLQRGAQSWRIAYSVALPDASIRSNKTVLVLLHPFTNCRSYWKYQLDDPQLASYTKVVVDAIGHGASGTQGRVWSYDLAAHAVLTVLEKLKTGFIQGYPVDARAVLYGDSQGGAHTGLRIALRDAKRVKDTQAKPLIAGVVACGTAAEEESVDFQEKFMQFAHDFATQCESHGPQVAIRQLAHDMCQDGYTDRPEFEHCRQHGRQVIEQSLDQALRNEHGNLDDAGKIMITNFGVLCFRKGLINVLAARPSRLGNTPVLVVHGTEDNAYPFERKYHERTVSAIGDANAELHVVQVGSHFVTATHCEEVDRAVVGWMKKHDIA